MPDNTADPVQPNPTPRSDSTSRPSDPAPRPGSASRLAMLASFVAGAVAAWIIISIATEPDEAPAPSPAMDAPPMSMTDNRPPDAPPDSMSSPADAPPVGNSSSAAGARKPAVPAPRTAP